MEDIKFINELGQHITISLLGFFRVDGLDKEFIMYSMVDDNLDNDEGDVLLGEVIRDCDTVQILGIESSEVDMVVAYYNEISKQVGGSGDE